MSTSSITPPTPPATPSRIDYSQVGDGTGTGGFVNTGEYDNASRYPYGRMPSSAVGKPLYKSLSEILTYEENLYNNEPAKWIQLEKLYKSAGYSNWKDAITGASMDMEKEGRSWEEFLNARAANPVIQKLVAANGNGSGGGPFYSRDTSVNLSSASEAARIADQTFTQEMGRTASNQEAADFQKALNAQQRANPQVSIQQGTQTKGSRVSRSSQSGGFDPTRFAREYAQSQEGYGEQFAGVTFMDVIDKAISDPNALDQIIAGG